MPTIDYPQYLVNLSNIKNILTILHPYNLDLPSQLSAFLTTPSRVIAHAREVLGYLDTTHLSYLDTAVSSNMPPIVTRLTEIIPPPLAQQIARIDQGKEIICCSLKETQLHDGLSIANKIDGCEGNHMVLVDDRRCILVPYQCNNRLCPLCNSRRSIIRFTRVLRAMGKKPDPELRSYDLRFATITIRNVEPNELRSSLSNLLSAWKRFRQRDHTWSLKVQGYIWNAEITYNRDRDNWHPHIHALMDGTYYGHHHFSYRWSQYVRPRGLIASSTDSVSVVRAYYYETDENGKKHKVKNLTTAIDFLKAIVEVTKYQSKPLKTRNGIRYLELHDAMYRQRMWGTAGTLQVPADPQHDAQYSLLAGLQRIISDPSSPWQTDPEFRALLIEAIFRDPLKLPVLIRSYSLVDFLVQAQNQSEKENDS